MRLLPVLRPDCKIKVKRVARRRARLSRKANQFTSTAKVAVLRTCAYESKLSHRELDRRFESWAPFTRVPFGVPMLDPQPCRVAQLFPTGRSAKAFSLRHNARGAARGGSAWNAHRARVKAGDTTEEESSTTEEDVGTSPDQEAAAVVHCICQPLALAMG